MTTAAGIGTRDGLVEMLRVLDRLEPDRTTLAAAERLECVRLARTLADRATILAAVLIAEADQAKASEQVTGTAMNSWLAIDSGASKREAGVVKQGRALTAHPVVAMRRWLVESVLGRPGRSPGCLRLLHRNSTRFSSRLLSRSWWAWPGIWMPTV